MRQSDERLVDYRRATEKSANSRAFDRAAVAASSAEPTVPFTVLPPRRGPSAVIGTSAGPDGNPGDPLLAACPDHVKAVSTLESHGWIGRLNVDAETDPTSVRCSIAR
jgi:hypothetical protein